MLLLAVLCCTMQLYKTRQDCNHWSWHWRSNCCILSEGRAERCCQHRHVSSQSKFIGRAKERASWPRLATCARFGWVIKHCSICRYEEDRVGGRAQELEIDGMVGLASTAFVIKSISFSLPLLCYSSSTMISRSQITFLDLSTYLHLLMA